jgi:DNA-binding CsgD family transcriptional regulator
MENEFGYIHFPLSLIKHLFVSNNPDTAITDIFEIGIYNYSKQFKIEDASAYRQVIYCYYRGDITDELQNCMQRLYDSGTLTIDEEYNGFYDMTFEPDELDELSDYAISNKPFREKCFEFFRMHQAMKSLELTGSIQHILSNSKANLKAVTEHEKQYLLKDVNPGELHTALTTVYEQGYYNADSINRNLRRIIAGGPANTISLSEREKAFLQLACSDMTYREIASRMCLSEKTVDGYRESIFIKFNVKSRVGMALEAIRHNLVAI